MMDPNAAAELAALEREMAQAVGYEGDMDHLYADQYAQVYGNTNSVIWDLVMIDRRIDVLAQFVLYPEFDIQPFHEEMLQWQDTHQECMILAWRGAAKSTYCTVVRCIFEILHNPNIRICLVADARDQSKKFLSEISNHFQKNERFREIFGDFVTGAGVWTTEQIEVNKKTAMYGEPTIFSAGMDTRMPSRHFDLIIVDDLVTKDNSKTPAQRAKVHDYFYETLYPTLISPSGRLFVLGTRWADEDIYGWFEKNDYKFSTLRISALDPDTELSRWDKVFPTERLHKIRKANLKAFELQYMVRSGVGLSGFFNEEHFIIAPYSLPEKYHLWQGVDPVVGKKKAKEKDKFSHSTVAIQHKTRYPFLVDALLRRCGYGKQVELVKSMYEKHPETVRVVIENNAFQDVMRQDIRERFPHVPCIGSYTIKDKESRAAQLALFFTDHQLRVRPEQAHYARLLMGFPNVKGSKDFFDSLEKAIGRGLRGARKKRTEAGEVGLI